MITRKKCPTPGKPGWFYLALLSSPWLAFSLTHPICSGFVTFLYCGGKNVIVVGIRWKPATGLRFSDVTINTTEIHNHEVAREIHSPEHDLEVKDKDTKEVHKYQTSKQIKKEKLFKKVRRHRPAQNVVNNNKKEPQETLSENEASSNIKKGEVVSDGSLAANEKKTFDSQRVDVTNEEDVLVNNLTNKTNLGGAYLTKKENMIGFTNMTRKENISVTAFIKEKSININFTNLTKEENISSVSNLESEAVSLANLTNGRVESTTRRASDAQRRENNVSTENINIIEIETSSVEEITETTNHLDEDGGQSNVQSSSGLNNVLQQKEDEIFAQGDIFGEEHLYVTAKDQKQESFADIEKAKMDSLVFGGKGEVDASEEIVQKFEDPPKMGTEGEGSVKADEKISRSESKNVFELNGENYKRERIDSLLPVDALFYEDDAFDDMADGAHSNKDEFAEDKDESGAELNTIKSFEVEVDQGRVGKNGKTPTMPTSSVTICKEPEENSTPTIFETALSSLKRVTPNVKESRKATSPSPWSKKTIGEPSLKMRPSYFWEKNNLPFSSGGEVKNSEATTIKTTSPITTGVTGTREAQTAKFSFFPIKEIRKVSETTMPTTKVPRVTSNWPIQQSAKTMRSEIIRPVEGGTEEAFLPIKRKPGGRPMVSSTTTTQRLFSEEKRTFNIYYLTVLPQEIDWTDTRKSLDIPIVYLLFGYYVRETFLLKVLLPCERRATEGSPAVQRTSSTVRSETI